MPDPLDETFKAIRQACSASLWSQAVELVRAAAVAGVSESEEEIVCRVRTPTRVVAPKVTLYPLDEEWDCDCDSKAPCCEHVAAAIIAARRAHQEGISLPSDARSGAHLAYRFKTAREHLILERYVVKPDGQAELLDRSVAGIASSASDTRRLTPTQSDIAIDRLMGSRLHGPLAGESLQGVLLALAGASHIELDGKPMLLPEGYHKLAWVHDHRGNIVEQTYLGLKDELVMHTRHRFARFTARYDPSGRRLEQATFGADGEPAVLADGSARLAWNYDSRGNRIEERFFGEILEFCQQQAPIGPDRFAAERLHLYAFESADWHGAWWHTLTWRLLDSWSIAQQ